MTPEEFETGKPLIVEMLNFMRWAGTLLIVLSFGGYALAGWTWFQGQPLLALGIAVTAYLFFRIFRLVAWRLTLARFQKRPAYRPWLGLLDQDTAMLSDRAALERIEARLKQKDNA